MMTEYLMQIITCGIHYVMWSLPLFLILFGIYQIKKPPAFLFRKLLHITAFTGVVFMNTKSPGVGISVICLVIGAILTYSILTIMEKTSWYGNFFVEKHTHEVKQNLAGFFLVSAALTEGFSLLTNELVAVNVVILIWGFGDAAAALIGIPFGKHKYSFGKQKKSIEGSVAFVVIGMLVSIIYLLIECDVHPQLMDTIAFARDVKTIVIYSFASSLVGAVTEIFSKDNWDNIFVPAVLGVVGVIFMLI